MTFCDKRGVDGRLSAVWAIGLCLFSAACASTPAIATQEPAASQPHPIDVAMSRQTHTLTFLASGDSLDPETVLGLDAFLARADPPNGQSVVVEHSASPGHDARVAAVVEALVDRGLTPRLREAGLPPTEVRVVVERYAASVPGCPNWSKPPGNDFANTSHSDFGCSTQMNLAAMVVDPRDLTFGKQAGATIGDPATAAMQRYRAGKTFAPPTESINLTTAPPSPLPSTGPGQ